MLEGLTDQRAQAKRALEKVGAMVSHTERIDGKTGSRAVPLSGSALDVLENAPRPEGRT